MTIVMITDTKCRDQVIDQRLERPLHSPKTVRRSLQIERTTQEFATQTLADFVPYKRERTDLWNVWERTNECRLGVERLSS